MNRALLLTRELNNMQEAARRQELNYKVLLTEVETKPERVETETK